MLNMQREVLAAVKYAVLTGMEQYVKEVLVPMNNTKGHGGRDFNITVVNRTVRVWQDLNEGNKKYQDTKQKLKDAWEKLTETYARSAKADGKYRRNKLDQIVDSVDSFYSWMKIDEAEACYRQGWADAITVLEGLLSGRVVEFKGSHLKDGESIWGEQRHD